MAEVLQVLTNQIVDLALILLAVLAVFLFVKSKAWLEVKIGAERFAQVSGLIREFILEAEEMYRLGELGKGEAKMEHVLDRLEPLVPYLNRDQLRGLVRAAVYRLNKSGLFK